MTSSKFSRRRTALKQPAICKTPPKPPLGPIPRPPPLLLAWAQAAGPSPLGGRYQISGLTRLSSPGPPGYYAGTITALPWTLQIFVSINETAKTLTASLIAQYAGADYGTAQGPPTTIPATGPIQLTIGEWTYTPSTDDATLQLSS